MTIYIVVGFLIYGTVAATISYLVDRYQNWNANAFDMWAGGFFWPITAWVVLAANLSSNAKAKALQRERDAKELAKIMEGL